MKTEDKSKLVEVFKGSPWEADLVQSMLVDNGVKCMKKDSTVVNFVLPSTAIDVALLVNEEKFEDATQVVREYIKNKKSE